MGALSGGVGQHDVVGHKSVATGRGVLLAFVPSLRRHAYPPGVAPSLQSINQVLIQTDAYSLKEARYLSGTFQLP